MKVERVWIVTRPGDHVCGVDGELLPEREFPEDSPVAALPANKGKLRLLTREAAPKPQARSQAPVRSEKLESLGDPEE